MVKRSPRTSPLSKFIRARTLKRGASCREIELDDWRYLFAAYLMGVFDSLFEKLEAATGEAAEDLQPRELRALLEEIMDGREFSLLVADKPVGLIEIARDRELPRAAGLAAVWFPWASPRNKVETVLKFIAVAREKTKFVVVAPRHEWQFWANMGRYGVMRRIGTAKNHFGEGLDGKAWESRRRAA